MVNHAMIVKLHVRDFFRQEEVWSVPEEENKSVSGKEMLKWFQRDLYSCVIFK